VSQELEQLYANRFDAADRVWKNRVWQILWQRVFSNWVKPDSILLDLGAGYCEFINHAVAARRIAVDLNPETAQVAVPGVEVYAVSADKLEFLADGSIDVVFSSNFLEHLPDKESVASVLDEIHRVLKPGGRVILMGPNIRYLADQYWDYFDHHVPLSHKSMHEGLTLHGFRIDHAERKFLPYTVQGSRLRWPWLVHLYLTLRPLSSHFFGKQFLISATKAP
jgi:SAM-dependent methyltransferase